MFIGKLRCMAGMVRRLFCSNMDVTKKDSVPK